MSSTEKTASLVQSLRQPIQGHFDTWWGPPQYTSWVDESLSWKNSCYIGDWSFLPSVRFGGRDLWKLFSEQAVNTMNNFQSGQSKHLLMCTPEGKMLEEGILSRTGENELRAFGGIARRAEFLIRKGLYDVSIEPLSLTKFHVQGPNSLHVMERVAGERLRDIRFMRARDIRIAGHTVTALRQGMSGEIGFELHAPLEHGKEVWAAIVAAGKEFDIHEMGARVSMLNHLEANYPTNKLDYMPALMSDDYTEYRTMFRPETFQLFYKIAGSFESDDIRDWYRSPIELGWGNRIKLDHQFVGREALAKELENPRRTMVTLVWNGEDVIESYGAFFRKGQPLPEFMEMPRDSRGFMWTDKVLRNGRLAGVSTSRGYSAYSREMLSLCTIDLEHGAPGTEVVLIWGNPGHVQKEIRATVQRAPYKENRGRVDLSTLPYL
jgi:vanillate/3-O-methylgallate O-demethylase